MFAELLVNCAAFVFATEFVGKHLRILSECFENVKNMQVEFCNLPSDFVFEYIEGPAPVSSEFWRTLKPGEWICARTHNKHYQISMLTWQVHKSQNLRLLRSAQPKRNSINVFPAVFKLNSKHAIAIWFRSDALANHTNLYKAEPSYCFNCRSAFVLLLLNRLITPVMKSGLFRFLQKKGVALAVTHDDDIDK